MTGDDQGTERNRPEKLSPRVPEASILIPQPEHLIALKLHSASSPDRRGVGMDWQTVVEETEPLRRCYLEHFDSAEKRLRDKNPKPFRMDF
jgi:hypothetical protein